MSDLIIGFSGTRHGMTEAQRESVTDLLKALQPAEVQHGDCIGADSTFHDLVLWHTQARIVIHPPEISAYRASRKVTADQGEIRKARPYLIRNRLIVNSSDVIIASPESMDYRKSGTWWTIECAKKHGVRVIIVHPDGEYESH